MILALI